MTKSLKIKLCDPASYGCMVVFFKPNATTHSVLARTAAAIETARGYALDERELHAISEMIAAAKRKERNT